MLSAHKNMAKPERRSTTRKLVNCPVFGAQSDQSDTVLPTNGDILR